MGGFYFFGYLSLVTWSGPGAPWFGTQLKISLRSRLHTIVLFVTNPLFKATLVVGILIVPTPHHPLYSFSKSVLQTSRKTNHSVSAISALLKSDADPRTPSFPSLVVTRIERCWVQGAARSYMVAILRFMRCVRMVSTLRNRLWESVFSLMRMGLGLIEASFVTSRTLRMSFQEDFPPHLYFAPSCFQVVVSPAS